MINTFIRTTYQLTFLALISSMTPAVAIDITSKEDVGAAEYKLILEFSRHGARAPNHQLYFNLTASEED